MGTTNSEPSKRAVCLTVTLGFVVYNLAAALAVNRFALPQVAAHFIWGLVFGQLSMVAVWGVLGPLPRVARLTAAFLALTALYGALFIGTWASGAPRSMLNDMMHFGLALPLFLLAVALPLLLLRSTMNWRIVNRDSALSAPLIRVGGFRILHLLAFTAAVAIALGMARWGVMLEFGPPGQAKGHVRLVSVSLGLALWSALSAPAVWVGLGTKKLWKGVGAFSAYIAAMTLGPAWLVASASLTFVGSFSTAYFQLLAAMAGAVAPTLITAIIARRRNYVLARALGRPGSTISTYDGCKNAASASWGSWIGTKKSSGYR